MALAVIRSIYRLFILIVILSNSLSNPVPAAGPSRGDIISGREFLSLFIPESPKNEVLDDEKLDVTTMTTTTISRSEEEVPNEVDNVIPGKGTESPTTTTTITTKATKEQIIVKTNHKKIVVKKLVHISPKNGNSNSNLSPELMQKNSEQQIVETTTLDSFLEEEEQQKTTSLMESNSEKVNLNSHRSELFIEEVDEPMFNSKDLINSESINVPSVIIPASSSSSSSDSSSPSLKSSQPEAQLSNTMGFTFTSESSSLSPTAQQEQHGPEQPQQRVSRSRTQRKQDGTASLPFQSVLFNQNRVGAVPRSISYASLTQKIGDHSHNHHHQTGGGGGSSMINWNFPRANQTAQSLLPKVYSEPAKIYSEPAKVYSEPAKIYGEPAKVYGEPEKVYSEPAKFYSEPAKIYSEPAKIYGEPSKIYSEPAKVYGIPPTPFYPLPSSPIPTTTVSYQNQPSTVPPAASNVPSSTSLYNLNRKVIFNLDKLPYDLLNAPDKNLNIANQQPVPSHSLSNSPQENGDSNGNKKMDDIFYNNNNEKLPPGETEDELKAKAKAEDAKKVGYVVEGRNYRKYRVEEKTPDGFIVGEYGVVSHNDGNLRGVRYTADSNINPRLIYDALLKFLSL